MLSTILLGASPVFAKKKADVRNIDGSDVDLLEQLQALQQEVSILRGMVEQQGYELRQLKQQQTENYTDLDNRIRVIMYGEDAVIPPADADVSADASEPPAPNTELRPSLVNPPGENQPSASSKPAPELVDPSQVYDNPVYETIEPASRTPVVSPTEVKSVEVAHYEAAYELLKNREFDKAKTAFREFLKDYPVGTRAPNAHYWLGELHMLSGDLNQAQMEFTVLLQNYPQHDKAADASLKLGKVYQQKGQNELAKKEWQRVITEYPDSTAALLAKDYLANL